MSRRRRLLLLAVGIMVLNLADALFTLRTLASPDAVEANPLMARFLDLGPTGFLVAKHLWIVVTVGLVLLLLDAERARRVLRGVFAVYLTLAVYHVVLWVDPPDPPVIHVSAQSLSDWRRCGVENCPDAVAQNCPAERQVRGIW